MPPRTTRKSHRPRVSDRTMVGTAQPLCLSASETEGRRFDMTMNLGKNEITAPHYNAGLDDEMPSSRRGSVFLDIPFYRTGLSPTGNRPSHFPGIELLSSSRTRLQGCPYNFSAIKRHISGVRPHVHAVRIASTACGTLRIILIVPCTSSH